MAPPKKDMPACETCRFFVGNPLDGTKQGACRRNPPTQGAMRGVWPVVNLSDWCGEYKREK